MTDDRLNSNQYVHSTKREIKMESAFYTTNQLAERINMSVAFVVSIRNRIIGGQKMGGLWRFNVAITESLIARGKPIYTK